MYLQTKTMENTRIPLLDACISKNGCCGGRSKTKMELEVETQGIVDCNSRTHHDDLGLVDFILTDKTGTITKNKMLMQYGMVQRREFGNAHTEIAGHKMRKQQEVGIPSLEKFSPFSKNLVDSLISILCRTNTSSD